MSGGHRPYATPTAHHPDHLSSEAMRRLLDGPDGFEPWMDLADEVMPLIDNLIVAVQEHDSGPVHQCYPNDCCEWACSIIDPAVSALLAWCERERLEPAEAAP